MAEPAVSLGPVPVLDLSGDGDNIAGLQAPGRLALLLIPALAVHAQQQLSAALGSVMDVPVVAAAGLEGDVGYKYRLLGVREGLEIALTHKILGVGGVGVALAEEAAVVFRLAAVIDLLCHAESGPGVGPSGVESQMGQDLCHLSFGDAVGLGCGEVILQGRIGDALADEGGDGDDGTGLEGEQLLP